MSLVTINILDTLEFVAVKIAALWPFPFPTPGLLIYQHVHMLPQSPNDQDDFDNVLHVVIFPTKKTYNSTRLIDLGNIQSLDDSGPSA